MRVYVSTSVAAAELHWTMDVCETTAGTALLSPAHNDVIIDNNAQVWYRSLIAVFYLLICNEIVHGVQRNDRKDRLRIS